MKKGRAVLTILLCSTRFSAVGCGKKDADYTWNAKESSIYVSNELDVESALVYTSEQFNRTLYAGRLGRICKRGGNPL